MLGQEFQLEPLQSVLVMEQVLVAAVLEQEMADSLVQEMVVLKVVEMVVLKVGEMGYSLAKDSGRELELLTVVRTEQPLAVVPERLWESVWQLEKGSERMSESSKERVSEHLSDLDSLEQKHINYSDRVEQNSGLVIEQQSSLSFTAFLIHVVRKRCES